MFDDVYDKRTPDLERQHKELLDHLEEYGEHYDLSVYSKWKKCEDDIYYSGANTHLIKPTFTNYEE